MPGTSKKCEQLDTTTLVSPSALKRPKTSVNGQPLQAVETLAYLGSALSPNANIDAEINNRISKASGLWEIEGECL